MSTSTAASRTRQSLCCECGAVRTVSDNYAPRGQYTSCGDTPEHIAEMQRLSVRQAVPYWQDREPYRRFLENLKCPACRRITEHAMLLPQGVRDVNEEEQGAEARDWARAYEVAEDIAALTGARINWMTRRSSKGNLIACLYQDLDCGQWRLTVYSGRTAAEVLDVLPKLYKALLTPDTRWFVTGPNPLDPDSIPTRSLAYGKD